MEDLKARILEAANSYDFQTIFSKACEFLCELREMDGSYCWSDELCYWVDEQFNRCYYLLTKEKDSILVAVQSSLCYTSIHFIVNHAYTCYTMAGSVHNIKTAYINMVQLCELHGLFTSENNVRDVDDVRGLLTIGREEDVDGLLSAMDSIIGEAGFVDLSD